MMFLKSDRANILIIIKFLVIISNIDNFAYSCCLVDY